jgi:hypothetical protein
VKYEPSFEYQTAQTPAPLEPLRTSLKWTSVTSYKQTEMASKMTGNAVYDNYPLDDISHAKACHQMQNLTMIQGLTFL